MRKISIVFEETDDRPLGDTSGQRFIVFMEGHDSDRMKLPDDQRTAAEYWAGRCFTIIQRVLSESGAAHTVHDLGDPAKRGQA